MLAALCAGAVASAVLATGPGAADGLCLRTDARFAPPAAFVPSPALTYDQDLVPAAAWIEVTQRSALGGATTVTLRVTGFAPGRAYGVQVHREPCAADPDAAGGRYQHEPGTGADQVSAGNEVWLDFTADERGAGGASAAHRWGFRRGEAASVVIHDAPGAQGVRVACFTVPFAWTV